MIRVLLFNDLRAGLPSDGFFDILELTDDTPVAGGFEKLHDRLDLRAHRPGGKVQSIHLAGGGAFDSPLVRHPPVRIYAVHIGGHNEEIRANLAGQELDPRGFILDGRKSILERGADDPVIGSVISENALGLQHGRAFLAFGLHLAVHGVGDVCRRIDPLDLDTQRRFIAPFTDSNYILGTDEMGRGTLTRLIYGGRISLIVGVTAMFATIVTGMIIGLLTGYYGGRVDNILMRFTDTMLCFPQVFLLLVLAAFITPTVISIALIIGFTSWMEVARIIRAQIQYIKEQDFVQASYALGASGFRIMFRELLPNAMAPVLVSATLNVANAVLMESYISFLGYGIQPPLASWGNMLTDAQAYFDLAPWLAILPGVMITLTVMSFNFLGDGLRDALDPRLRMMSG